MKANTLAASLRHKPDVDNTAATLTLPAGATIKQINWSYNNTPTNGEITIAVGGTTVWSQYVTSGGPGTHTFDGTGVNGDFSGTIVITLVASAGVKGQLAVITGAGK